MSLGLLDCQPSDTLCSATNVTSWQALVVISSGSKGRAHGLQSDSFFPFFDDGGHQGAA